MAENIVKKIDYQSLSKCMEANREVCEFLDNGRLLWKQMILKNVKGNSYNLIQNTFMIVNIFEIKVEDFLMHNFCF